MSIGPTTVTSQCYSTREFFSASNLKAIFRGFVYEYETPKIVTIHSISSKKIFKKKKLILNTIYQGKRNLSQVIY
jgi:hypothetical protein